MKLGQKVRVRAVVESRRIYDPKVFKRRVIVRREVEPFSQEYVGYIAGIRTLKEGYTETDFESYYFKQTGHKRVYLVAVNLAKTVFALPEDVEPID